MKTLVIALDGFDIRYCPKDHLELFTQRYHGHHYVNYLEKTFTPICFSAILTGKDPRTFGYTQDFIYRKDQDLYSGFWKLLYKLRLEFLPDIKLNLRERFVKNDRADPTRVDRDMTESMKKHTIFSRLAVNYAVNPISVPSYNEDMDLRRWVAKMQGEPYLKRKNELQKDKLSMRKRWLNALDNLPDYDLTFFYSDLPDQAHHILASMKELQQLVIPCYNYLAKFLKIIKSLKNIAILILSDHGFRHIFNDRGMDIGGGHSTMGFWSLNINTTIKPKTIFDFYDLIYELVVIR